MPGVFADILNSLSSGQPYQTPVQKLDQAGSQALQGAQQGISDFELLLRKFFGEQFGSPIGLQELSPQDNPRFTGPLPQGAPVQMPNAQEFSILDRIRGRGL